MRQKLARLITQCRNIFSFPSEGNGQDDDDNDDDCVITLANFSLCGLFAFLSCFFTFFLLALGLLDNSEVEINDVLGEGDNITFIVRI